MSGTETSEAGQQWFSPLPSSWGYFFLEFLPFHCWDYSKLGGLCKLFSSLHTQRNKPNHNNSIWKSRNLSQDHGVSIKVTGGKHLCPIWYGRQAGRKEWEKELVTETTWKFISINKKVLQAFFLPFSNKWPVTNNIGLSNNKTDKALNICNFSLRE